MREIYVKSVLNKHKKRDSWFLDDFSINPYTGCQYNCVYCYIHGGRYGRGGELAVKMNSPNVLEKQLSRAEKLGEHGFILISSANEAWQPVEERYEVTRKCLEVIKRHRFPVHCLTKSPLILRDLDLLGEIDKMAVLPDDLKIVGRGVLITFSLSTLDPEISKIFEPGAPNPFERLETMKEVRDAGFKAGVAYIPVLPFISDGEEELEKMIELAKEFGADYIFVGALTLYGSGKELYYRVLRKYFPEYLPKYERLYLGRGEPTLSYRRKLETISRRICVEKNVRYMII
ncbi:MAG: radical SAM protein [Thaumarchaeota archaeon]|nr:MAG: radical SAM protein [Nitrososphaerota archaeon]